MNTHLIFKLLGDKTRLQICLLIYLEGQCCVCELADALQASQPKISRHLALLKHNSLLEDTRKEQWVYYALHSNQPAWINEIYRVASENMQTEAEFLAVHERLKANRLLNPNPCG